VTEVIPAKEIKPRLEILIAEADVVNPNLANRLRQISRWLKDTKPGSLTKKRELMFFLRELIEDVEIWLALEEVEPLDKQLALSELTPTERYWFTFLFPTWLTLTFHVKSWKTDEKRVLAKVHYARYSG